MEARAGIGKFPCLNNLARGGTIQRSAAFRKLPPRSVPLNSAKKTPPTDDGRGRNFLGRSVAAVPSPIHKNISNDEYTPLGIRRQRGSVDVMCSSPPEQTRAINCSMPGANSPEAKAAGFQTVGTMVIDKREGKRRFSDKTGEFAAVKGSSR